MIKFCRFMYCVDCLFARSCMADLAIPVDILMDSRAISLGSKINEQR